MVNSFCKAEDFQQITNLENGASLVRFSKEPIITEVYENYQPTGRFEDTGLVSFTEEYLQNGVSIEALKEARIKEIEMYDSSNAINGLFVNGKEMWFDKVTRTCINYSIQVEKNSGQETTVLFYEGEGYTLPIDLAIQMFSALELYAKACYNKTEEHKNNIKALNNIEDLLNYNIKSGYPEKLSFNV